MKRVTLIIPLYLKILNGNPCLEMALISQVLIKQCLRKVFPTSNDFVPNGSSLLKEIRVVLVFFSVYFELGLIFMQTVGQSMYCFKAE